VRLGDRFTIDVEEELSIVLVDLVEVDRSKHVSITQRFLDVFRNSAWWPNLGCDHLVVVEQLAWHLDELLMAAVVDLQPVCGNVGLGRREAGHQRLDEEPAKWVSLALMREYDWTKLLSVTAEYKS